MVKTQINLNIDIPDNFRNKAREKFGDKKGSLTKAFQEAIDNWVK